MTQPRCRGESEWRLESILQRSSCWWVSPICLHWSCSSLLSPSSSHILSGQQQTLMLLLMLGRRFCDNSDHRLCPHRRWFIYSCPLVPLTQPTLLHQECERVCVRTKAHTHTHTASVRGPSFSSASRLSSGGSTAGSIHGFWPAFSFCCQYWKC